MAKVKIDVEAKPASGHVLVIIDGVFLGLDKDGKGSHSVSKPPTSHWFTVTLLGQPGDKTDYKITTGTGETVKQIDKDNLEIAISSTCCSTARVDFEL